MNKRTLSYLMALTLMFSQGGLLYKTKAEGFPKIEQFVSTEKEYTPFEIESIFTMTKEESEKMISIIVTPILPVYYNDLVFYVPVHASNLKVLKEGNRESINDKEEILFSDLKKYVDHPFIEKLLERSDGEVREYKELSTDSLIAYNFFGSSEYFVNYDFFKKIVNKKNIDKIEISAANGFDFFMKEEYIDEYEVFSQRFNTLETFFEFYKKAIPGCYWPVIHKLPEKNANNSIPKLKDEILDIPYGSDNFLLFVARMETDNTAKFFFTKTDGDTRDVLTGEIVQYENGKFNNEYFRNIGINGEYDLDYLGYRSSVVSDDFFEENQKIKSLCIYFTDCETVRDVFETYQYLPREMQVDYSYFDFSKSPNVDSAWLASRPAPPTPTPPPYAELTIGSSGQEVLDMKQRFLKLGYFRTTEFNDRFTDNTADTVALFEKNNGLPVDGVADAVMLGVLFSDKALGK